MKPKINDRQRRKEEAIVMAMSVAAMYGKPMRVLCTDEATAKRVFDQAKREIQRTSRP